MKYKCDIILLSYESPELLKKCVESVFENTRVPARLIIVDNASTDKKVISYIQSLRGNKTIAVEKVLSFENEGFAAGMNKGMRISTAPYVCLLNNDCIVTAGWLEEMIKVAVSDEGIGLVNPQSNTFGSRPDGSASIHDHAEFLSDREGRYVELGHAIGFACLVKKEVVDRIGYLDEAYVGVCYEDTDFSLRAYKAGYISVMSESAYVFHKEQASRKNLKGKEEVYARNKEIFETKWGSLLRVFYLENENSKDKIFVDYSMLLKPLARERIITEAWFTGIRSVDAIYDSMGQKGIVRHADVGIKAVREAFCSVKVMWRVLTKKKKYNAVILPERGPVSILRALKWIHKAEILVKESGNKVRSDSDLVFDLKNPFSLAEWLRGKAKN